MILNWWTDTSPVKDMDGIIADGAIRSGKTVCMSLSFIMWAMSSFEEQNFAMCGKTIGSFRRNVIGSLKLMLTARGYTWTDSRYDNLLTVSKGGKTNYFYIFGGRDERSQDLIQCVTLAGVFFDEVALMPESFVNQATGRCSVTGSKFWFNCNPNGPKHWFKTEWIDKAKEKHILYVHFMMDDNLSLSEKIKERYRAMYSGVFFKRYILGLWVLAEGLIYGDAFDEKINVVNVKELAAAYEKKTVSSFWKGKPFISCDYGTQNATVFLLWRHGMDNAWYIVGEYYYSGREKSKQKTDSEFAEDLDSWLSENCVSVRDVVVDPAAASFKAELRKHGYSVHDAKNSVIDGIRDVSSALKMKQILVDCSCKNLIREFFSYVWDEKAAAKGEDKPIKVDDHAMDALRYGWQHTKRVGNVKTKPKNL